MMPSSIPQQRVIQKLDEYMAHRDYAGAERHLLYWLEEALAVRDARGQLLVRNELVGHFRKTGDKARSLEHAQKALELVEELGLEHTISAGTTYTNVATACNAFGEHERSLALFKKAAKLYEESPHTEPQLMGGLYNNMALTCVALGRFDEADELYAQALAAMGDVENGELEQAITYLNMADAAVARANEADAAVARANEADAAVARANAIDLAGEMPAVREGSGSMTRGDCAPVASKVAPHNGCVQGGDPAAASPVDFASCEKEVERLLETARALLDTPSVPRDGYYAFVCEKCAPAFGYHGYFLVEADLRERAKAIYERA